jgi:outer membrane protein TolC
MLKRLNALALQQPLLVAQTSLQAAESQLQLTTAQFEAGNVEALNVIDARSLYLQAERTVWEARTALWRASWELEWAIQFPISHIDPK